MTMKNEEMVSSAAVDTESPMGIAESTVVATAKPVTGSNRMWCSWKRFAVAGTAVLLLLAVGVGIGVAVRGRRDGRSTAASEPTDQTGLAEQEPSTQSDSSTKEEDCRRSETSPSDRLLQERGQNAFRLTGCFLKQTSQDSHPVPEGSRVNQAAFCNDSCETNHFGVADNTCFCYVDPPQERLSVGSCSSVCETPLEQRMETFMKTQADTDCNQDASLSVRNFLVEEDDVPFGFDLVYNTFRPSIFTLTKDECGTNMYEVQTEVSEDSNTLSTNVQSVSEFANEIRDHLSSSVSTSASVSYRSLFVKASAKVSASLDTARNAIFSSSGASSVGSQVYTSTGVKRLAEVKLLDFENRNYFVTLNEQFASLLRSYRDDGFSKTKAEEIIAKYGQLVVTRGIFGGYLQLRSTVDSKTLRSHFESEEDSRKCYEAAMSAEASGFGFKGSVDVKSSGCTEEAIKEMQKQQNSFQTQTSSVSAVGGTVEDGELVVTPDRSTLLSSRDMYPAGDGGIQLRLLSDFLSPAKISPLEVRRHQITEKDFGAIQAKLQAHILDYLEVVESTLKECSNCTLSYLEEVNDILQCQCYEPTDICLPASDDVAGTCEDQSGKTTTTYCSGGEYHVTVDKTGLQYVCSTKWNSGWCRWDCSADDAPPTDPSKFWSPNRENPGSCSCYAAYRDCVPCSGGAIWGVN